MTDNLTDFTVTLKMARSTGPLADEVEHRTFTARGPARNAKQAEAIAFGLGHGINEATGSAWKFCGGSDSIVVQPAAVQPADSEPTFTVDDMHAAGLETVAAEMERDAARRECDRLRAENAELREHMNLDRQAVIALRQREEQARAQLADLADKLHKAQQEIASHTKADTAWANEVGRLKHELSQADRVIASLRAEIDEYDAAGVA